MSLKLSQSNMTCMAINHLISMAHFVVGVEFNKRTIRP